MSSKQSQEIIEKLQDRVREKSDRISVVTGARATALFKLEQAQADNKWLKEHWDAQTRMTEQAQARVKLYKAYVEATRDLVEALGEGREYEDWGAPIRAACVALAALAEGE